MVHLGLSDRGKFRILCGVKNPRPYHCPILAVAWADRLAQEDDAPDCIHAGFKQSFTPAGIVTREGLRCRARQHHTTQSSSVFLTCSESFEEHSVQVRASYRKQPPGRSELYEISSHRLPRGAFRLSVEIGISIALSSIVERPMHWRKIRRNQRRKSLP